MKKRIAIIAAGAAAITILFGAGTASAITGKMCRDSGGQIVWVKNSDGSHSHFCWGSHLYPMWAVYPDPGDWFDDLPGGSTSWA